MGLRLDSASKPKMQWEKDSKGCYRAIATLGIAELPLTYYALDSKGDIKTHVETITSDSLFDDDSLNTAFGLPICLGHPKSLYYNRNDENLMIGCLLQEFIRVDDTLYMPCVISDKRGIALIDSCVDSGFQPELSPGYLLPKGKKEREDGVLEQVHRVYDHIALLNPGEGRGGQNLTICIDSKDAIGKDLNYKLVKNMPKKFITIDSINYEVEDEELCKTVQKILQENTKLTADSLINESKAKDLNIKIDSLNKELDKLKGEYDAMLLKASSEKEKPNNDGVEKEIQDRLDTWMIVTPEFMNVDSNFKPDITLTSDAIKSKYIKQFCPNLNIDGKSAEYINGVWEVSKPSGIPRAQNDSNFSILNGQGINNDAKNKPSSVSRIEANGKVK